MKTLNFGILVLWLWVVASSAIQGVYLPMSEVAGQSSSMGPWIIALPVVIIVGSMFGNRLPGRATLGRLIDRKFGRGAYLRFLRQLRVELLLATMAFVIGGVGLLRSLDLDAPRGAFIVSGFFLSGGLAFLVTHFITRRRGLYDS